MNPGRLLSRTALLDEAIRLSPTRGCRRAIEEGRAEVLGGFAAIPPYGLPGWILRVRSRHGRTWLLAVLVDEVKHVYTARLVDEVPWSEWVGRKGRKRWNAYDGDVPEEVDRERAKRALIHRFAHLRGGDRDESVEGDQG
jgi:hypothetical protein